MVFRLLCALVTGLFITAAEPAQAQKQPGKRRLSPVAAPSAATDSERQAPAQFRWTERPTEGDMDERADQKRDEAIAKLRKLIPTIDDGPQQADLMFRLSEMYWAKARFKNLRAMEEWDNRIEQWSQRGSKGREPRLEDTRAFAEAKAHKKNALALYRRILDRYDRYERKDEVLYNLGNSLYESGERKEGMSMYYTLTKQFPRSRYTPDAWLQLGEHFFNVNNLASAERAYNEAMNASRNLEKHGGDEARVFSYALYKLAWCDFNLQDYETALDKFNQVIEYAKKQRSKEMSKRDRIQLYEEALSDMVRVYSHLDAFDGAFEFYQREVGKRDAYAYLHRLARRYNDEGKYALEIKTYRRLNNENPDAPQAPGNQTGIMSAYAQLGRNNNVRKEARRLIDLYSPGGTWWRANAGDAQVQRQALEVVERELAGLVVEQHRAAQETKLVETYLLARDLYKEYLTKFTSTENAYKFGFYYAEILFELDQFRDAAEAYSAVASRSGEFAKPAAYTAILAWEKVLSGEKADLGRKIRERKQGKAKGALKRLERIEALDEDSEYAAKPLSDIERKIADACDRFTLVAPKDEEVVKVRFKSARLYFINNQFEEAAKRFEFIIDRYPRDSLAKTAAESIIQSFNVRKDWANLNKYARKVQKKRSLMVDSEFATTVQQYIEGASFNEILLVYEPSASPLEAADRYTRFVSEFPKSTLAMVALYNAMVNYDEANVLEKSISTAQRLLNNFRSVTAPQSGSAGGVKVPDPSELREKTTFLLATFKARLAEMDEAAGYYERYAANYPKGEKLKEAMFNAGLLRESLGQYDAAAKNFRAYVNTFTRADDRVDVAWRVGEILEKKKDWAETERHFSSFGATYRARNRAQQLCAKFKAQQARVRLGQATRDLERGWQAIRADWSRLPAQQQGDSCALEAAGAAAFALVDPNYQSFLALKLVGSESEVSKRLIEKLKQVDELQQRYTDVLAIGAGDYGIASLYRIGRVYQDIADGIYNSQCPRRLTEEQCMIYQSALQEKAFPLEERAIEAYEKAIAKAYELGLYNEWLTKTNDALKTYQPQRFPQAREFDLIASEAAFEAPNLMEQP
ncbi:MAG: tetratricopeptide repeat protein [Myxococcota bacterium]